MRQLEELVSLCKCSVEISINDHKDCYESVEQYIKEDEREDIDNEVFSEMIKRDTIVRVQAYPHTPIGFYVIYHYDIEKAVEMAIDAVKSNK